MSPKRTNHPSIERRYTIVPLGPRKTEDQDGIGSQNFRKSTPATFTLPILLFRVVLTMCNENECKAIVLDQFASGDLRSFRPFTLTSGLDEKTECLLKNHPSKERESKRSITISFRWANQRKIVDQWSG